MESNSSSSCNSEESAIDAAATRLQLEHAVDEAKSEEDNEEGEDKDADVDLDDEEEEDEEDAKEIKLPNVSFGYYYGRSLQTMHTSLMLMLSGCPGEGVVEHVNGRMIERTFDMLDSLLLDPDQYNKQLGRMEKSRFMDAFQKAASEKAASLSLGDDHPSVFALSLVEGEQGIDPIAVCEDFEVYDGKAPDNNPCLFSHVELISGAMRRSALSSSLNESAFKSAAIPVCSSIFGGQRSNEEKLVSRTGLIDETATRKDCQQAPPTAIDVPLDDEQQLAQNDATKSNEKQESTAVGEDFEFADEIEIQFTEDADTSVSLFQDSWNYPSSIAMVFDDFP